jgi:hypothetical protein
MKFKPAVKNILERMKHFFLRTISQYVKLKRILQFHFWYCLLPPLPPPSREFQAYSVAE